MSPEPNTLDKDRLAALIDIASPIAAASDYTICSENDQSTGPAKRISFDVLVHANAKSQNKPMLAAIVRHVLRAGQQSQYARNSISAKVHAGKPADVVWGYIYLREIDRPMAHWVCRFQWISPNLDADFRPTAFQGEGAGDGLIIDWKSNTELAELMDAFRDSKTNYLARADTLISQLPNLIAVLETINQAGQLGRNTKRFPCKATAFESSWDDSLTPPQECQRLDETIGEILATVGNAGLNWSSLQERTSSQTLSLSKAYHSDLIRLAEEFNFLRSEVR